MSEPPDPSKAPSLDPIIEEMHTQNDRGTAIVGSTFLEEKLAEAIEGQWPAISNTQRDRLFAGYGPLSSFSAKIEVARAMGVLNVLAASDCHKIRVIRNDAAHVGTTFSFDNPDVQKRLDEINCIKHLPIDVAADRRSRNQFTGAIKILFAYLFLQAEWKERFGHKAVMPDYGST